MPLNISNVALLNNLTQKADRVGIKKLDDGKKSVFSNQTTKQLTHRKRNGSIKRIL